MSDIYSSGDRIEKTYKKLEESDLSSSNKADLEEFIEELMAQNLSDHKIYRYIQSFRVLSPVIDFKLKNGSRKDLIQLVGKINQNNIPEKDYAEQSKIELKKAIKKFYKWVYSEDDPKVVSFMSLHLKTCHQKKIDPNKLPTKENVENMVLEAKNPRDRAMIKLLWESGARIGEFLNLDWSDINKADDCYRLDLDGKTGMRTVPIVESRNLLDSWEDYQKDDLEPVFTSFQRHNRLSYNTANKQLKECGKRAGLNCKLNPHAFRKSRATYLASERDANVFQLMNFFGWSKAETAKTYVRLAEQDLDELVLKK